MSVPALPDLSLSRSSLSLIALGALAGAGCGSSSSVGPAGAPPAVVVAVPPAIEEAPEPEEPARPSANGAICGDRAACEILKEHDAGKDGGGQALSVVLAFTGFVDVNGDEVTLPKGKVAARDEGVSYADNGETIAPRVSDGELIGRYEYHLVIREGDAIMGVEKLFEIVNDGHGAGGIGEDTIEIGPNRITRASEGGSAVRWSEEQTWSLSPRRHLAEDASSYHSGSGVHIRERVEWASMRSAAVWFSPPCEASGDAPPLADWEGQDEYERLGIPAGALPGSFRLGDWRTTRLGSCALAIDASADGAFIVGGSEGARDDASFQVVAAAPGELYVEVRDDAIVGPSARPADDDHLEIWVSDGLPSWTSPCVEASWDKKVVAWSVGIADGKVAPLHGKPKASLLQVERAADPSGSVRFKIVTPSTDPKSGLTIAYADSDGKKVERRVATSKLVNGKGATLGTFEPFDDNVICSVKDGALSHEIRATRWGQD